MPFNLSHTLASFLVYINKILTKQLDIFVIVYLDDNFTYTKNIGQAHVDNIWLILKKLQKYSFFAKLEKDWFHKNDVRFLSYIVLAQRTKIVDKKIEAIMN